MITFHFHLQPQYKYELFHINFTRLRNLYFTCESRNTLKSFSWFRAVQTISKPDMEHSGKSEIRLRSRAPDIAKFCRFTLFCRGSKDLYKDLQSTCTTIVMLIKPFV